MEENQRNNRPKVDFTVVLSFTVALFAIFSLAFFGIVSNQGTGVSYAADDTVTSGQPFTLKSEEYVISAPGTDSPAGNYETEIFYGIVDGETNHRKPIFCVQNSVQPAIDEEYVMDGTIDMDNDYRGLIYLLEAPVSAPTDTVTGEEENVRTWIRQNAIWGYLKELHTGDQYERFHDGYRYTLAQISAASITQLNKVPTGGTAEPIYSGENLAPTVASLITNALNYSKTSKIAIANNKYTIERKEGEDFYKSNLLSITATDDLLSYSVSLSGVDDAYIVDKDGKKLNLTGLTPDKQFMVVIPAEKIEEKNYTLNVTVTGTFEVSAGRYYMAKVNGATSQKVISVFDTTMTDDASLPIPFVGCPDTGMNVTQTIYFVGLIVLLCGVGIIYANAKPIEKKQQ